MPYLRSLEWRVFSARVLEHINLYTIPQYGDKPDDEVEKWSPTMCMLSIAKYVKRFENGKRGQTETLRDMLKIAHFACLAYNKMKGDELDFLKVYGPKLKPGDYGYTKPTEEIKHESIDSGN